MQNTKKQWFVYIINSTDDSLYTGITTDIERRWHEHSSTNKGAKFFRGRKPKQLLFVSLLADRSSATKLEMSIKNMNRKNKFLLIDSLANQVSQYTKKLTNLE